MMHPAVGFSALVGLSTHTFFDGVSIASGFLVSVPLGLLIFFAVVLHKIPEGLHGGVDRARLRPRQAGRADRLRSCWRRPRWPGVAGHAPLHGAVR